MKIKVLKFEVSNGSSAPLDGDVGSQWSRTALARLKRPYEVEAAVNEFCKGKDVIDIKINAVDVKYHNNARGNTIELWYTIIYDEKEV